MSAFTNLFNTCASPTSTEIDRKLVNKVFKQEQADITEQNKLNMMHSMTEILSGCDITEKVDGSGYNITVPRAEGESNKEWANNAKYVASQLKEITRSGITVNHEGFKYGRMVAEIDPGFPHRDLIDDIIEESKYQTQATNDLTLDHS